jgi:hypothetical protein
MSESQASGLPKWARYAIAGVAVIAVLLFAWDKHINELTPEQATNVRMNRAAELERGREATRLAEYARDRKDLCLKRGYQPPRGMTTEQFCEAYGNVQAVCLRDGKTGGVCE